MKIRFLLLPLIAASLPLIDAQPASGPALPHKLVEGWPQLPGGWNFGECTSVDVDKDDNVWVLNRGPRKLIKFDRHGRMIHAWEEVPVNSAHGLRIDPQGNIWLVDVGAHAVLKFSAAGRLLMVITTPGGRPGDNDSKYAFNQPASLTFTPAGDFYVADGYTNSRVVKFNKDGEHLLHWGRKGTGDGEFNLVHDVCLDSQGRVYVADRANGRVQIFDADGRFLQKWTNLGSPWGLYYAAKQNAIYMADGVNNRVLKLDLEGRILGVLGSFGKKPGAFDFAHHLAVDSYGAIYVTEITNWRVQKFAVP
jgi:DNA-binding beta-propeller fold protein YncE